MQEPLTVSILEAIFNDVFEKAESTILISGADEPLYLPSQNHGELNRIFSTRDYCSSALHEISHWCIAGRARRTRLDYGYWYEPDGRNEDQQRLFERVEIKPQALEWLFSEACGLVFRLSVDNINQPDFTASREFKLNVCQQAHEYLENGLPARAQIFLNALLRNFRGQQAFLNKCAINYQNLG